MTTESSICRCRRWYALLLRLYPKDFRDRFAEPMQQTFNDLLRERIESERNLLSFVLRIFLDTFAGAIGENMTVFSRNKSLVRILLITGLILLLPLTAMQFTDEVDWGLADFAVAGALLFGAGFIFESLARKADSVAYRVAVGIAAAAALLLVWVNLAVGIIGNENNPANLMYIGVLVIGIGGAAIARFHPKGMARALLAMALAQFLVAAIAEVTGTDHAWLITGFFVALWLASAWLFHKASRKVGVGPL